MTFLVKIVISHFNFDITTVLMMMVVINMHLVIVTELGIAML